MEQIASISEILIDLDAQSVYSHPQFRISEPLVSILCFFPCFSGAAHDHPTKNRQTHRGQRRAEDDAFRGLCGNHGRQRRDRHVRHHGLGLHGRHGHLCPRRHPIDSGGARAGRGAHGGWLCPCERPPWRGHWPKRPGHQQLRHRHCGGLLGAQPGGHRHP